MSNDWIYSALLVACVPLLVARSTNSQASVAPQSIYYPPSVLFVPTREKYAVAFGTGNRCDITSLSEPAGRFIAVTDDWD